MLFMGEEYGATTPWRFFTSHPEPELGKVTAQGRIEEFERMGWDPTDVPDPQDPETFTRSRLNWAEAADGDHARLLELYRRLIALRRSTPELSGLGFEDTAVAFSEADGWLRLRRGSVEVAMNFSAEPRRARRGRCLDRAGHRRRRAPRQRPARPARPQCRHHLEVRQDVTNDLCCSRYPL